MEIKRILVATDFSANSQTAIECASLIASAADAQLFIVHVDDETPGLVFGDVGYGYVSDLDKIVDDEMAELRKIVPAQCGVEYEHHLLRGDAAEEILNFAETEHIDLIVVGSHGRTGVFHLLMGSVAEEIVQHAECSVLTVKNPTDQPPSKENRSIDVSTRFKRLPSGTLTKGDPL